MTIFYTLFIYPVELLLKILFNFAYDMVGDYGVSLILLSLFVNILLIPLYHVAERWKAAEKFIRAKMAPELASIKTHYSGQKKFYQTKEVYRRYSYSPIYSLRASLGLLIQIPFFLAAYHYLSDSQVLSGVPFLFIDDLGAPDSLIGKFNLLPLLMTIVNVFSVSLHVDRTDKSERLQLYGLSILFFILLYDRPAGLIIYWTVNNIFFLVKGYVEKRVVRPMTVPQPHLSRENYSVSGILNRFIPTLYILFGSMFPTLLYLSGNLNDVTTDTVASFIVIGLASAVCIYITFRAFSMIVRDYRLQCTAAVVFSYLVFGYFMIPVFRELVLSHLQILFIFFNKQIAVVFVIAVLGLLVAFVAYKRIVYINIITSIMLLTVLISFLSEAAVYTGYDVEKSSLSDIKFKRKHSLYILVPDGYLGATNLKERGIYADSINEDLRQKDFRIYPGYSNYAMSIFSILSFMDINHHYYKAKQQSVATFKTLSGDNMLYNTFKNNGYYTSIVHETEQMLQNACHSDYCYPANKSEFSDLNMTLTQTLFYGNRFIMESLPQLFSTDNNDLRRQTYVKELHRVIQDRNVPKVLYSHFKHPGHAELGCKDEREALKN